MVRHSEKHHIIILHPSLLSHNNYLNSLTYFEIYRTCINVVYCCTYAICVCSIVSSTGCLVAEISTLTDFLQALRLPCTFRGVSSLTDVVHTPYIADTFAPYQIKAYKICQKKIPIVFDSNESASLISCDQSTRTL